MEVPVAQLGELQNLLRARLPRSLFPYNCNQLRAESVLPSFARHACLVDAWPSPSFLLTAVGEPLSGPRLWTSSLFAFHDAPDQAALRTFLATLRRQHNFFRGVPVVLHFQTDLEAGLRDFVASELGDQATLSWPCRDMAVMANGEPQEDPPEVPGLSLEPLRASDGPWLLEKWYTDYMKSSELWADRAEWLPSMGYRRADGSLAAMMTTSPAGMCTHGWVAEELRSRGLVRACADAVGRLQRQAACEPFGFLTLHNKASLNAMTKMGLKHAGFEIHVAQITPHAPKI